jgi:hypothetical protein
LRRRYSTVTVDTQGGMFEEKMRKDMRPKKKKEESSSLPVE